jgi:hypothetical protein
LPARREILKQFEYFKSSMPVPLRGTGLIVFKDRNGDGVLSSTAEAWIRMNSLPADRRSEHGRRHPFPKRNP